MTFASVSASKHPYFQFINEHIFINYKSSEPYSVYATDCCKKNKAIS